MAHPPLAGEHDVHARAILRDTAVNLVDMILRLQKEGLGANTVFYLIQNKY
jgi:hypothetical protein